MCSHLQCTLKTAYRDKKYQKKTSEVVTIDEIVITDFEKTKKKNDRIKELVELLRFNK